MAIDGNTGAVNKLGNYAKPQSARENYISTGNGLFDIRTGKVVEGTQAPRSGASGTSGYDAQIVRTLSQQHIAWMKANYGEPETNSPYYAPLQATLGIASSQPQQEEHPVAVRINQLRAEGWSPEQIKEGLKANGLDEFESLVW